jgi:hypothetical protein
MTQLHKRMALLLKGYGEMPLEKFSFQVLVEDICDIMRYDDHAFDELEFLVMAGVR